MQKRFNPFQKPFTPLTMIETIAGASPENLARFDAIVDVRTPDEFAEDRIPGAINLPVLTNEERAEVGTIYVQESRFRARRIGAAHIARNVARHLETEFAGMPAAFRPLLYCWRGGMRSGAMATILSQVGWRTGVLQGGYKTWRREVVAALRDEAAPAWKIVLIDGQTGTAKSDILNRLGGLGVQVVDLEELAAHRGSVFGGFVARPQPGQKLFESLLWRELRGLDPARPIVVEAESCRIGRCEIPSALWRAMLGAPRLVVKAAAAERALYLTTAYADIIADGAAVLGAIARLAPFHSKEQIEDWREMADAEQFPALAESLMRVHYDPLYDRTRKSRDGETLAEIALDGFSEEALDKAAAEIGEVVKRIDRRFLEQSAN